MSAQLLYHPHLSVAIVTVLSSSLYTEWCCHNKLHTAHHERRAIFLACFSSVVSHVMAASTLQCVREVWLVLWGWFLFAWVLTRYVINESRRFIVQEIQLKGVAADIEKNDLRTAVRVIVFCWFSNNSSLICLVYFFALQRILQPEFCKHYHVYALNRYCCIYWQAIWFHWLSPINTQRKVRWCNYTRLLL